MSTRTQVLLGFFVALLLPIFAFALNTIATGFQVGATQVTIDAHGVCQVAVATDNKSYFVPTNTADEWSAFRTNKPSGVTLAACQGWLANTRCAGTQMVSGETRFAYNVSASKCSPSPSINDGSDACSEPTPTPYTVYGMSYYGNESTNYGWYYFSSEEIEVRNGPTYDYSTQAHCAAACDATGAVCCQYDTSGARPLCLMFSDVSTAAQEGSQAYIAASMPNTAMCTGTWTEVASNYGCQSIGSAPSYGVSSGSSLTQTQCQVLCEKRGAVECLWSMHPDNNHTCHACSVAGSVNSFIPPYGTTRYKQVCTPN